MLAHMMRSRIIRVLGPVWLTGSHAHCAGTHVLMMNKETPP